MVNKSKKELFDENKKLRKRLKSYEDFWETDAIDECTKQMRFTKKTIYIISAIFLIIGAFLLGLAW